jgi:hypothetical protein
MRRLGAAVTSEAKAAAIHLHVSSGQCMLAAINETVAILNCCMTAWFVPHAIRTGQGSAAGFEQLDLRRLSEYMPASSGNVAEAHHRGGPGKVKVLVALSLISMEAVEGLHVVQCTFAADTCQEPVAFSMAGSLL